jgi:tetratricopeptide (TPR) repeat protein
MVYTFDMNRPRPAEAVVHLERYVQMMPNDLSGMFVLARAHYMTENYEGALELYDRIISKSKDPNVRTEVEKNKEIVWSQMNG